jgi:release factor glutamine methyltransferase
MLPPFWLLAVNLMAPTTVKDALQRATLQLRAVTDRPRLEAELLLAHLLEERRIFLHAHPDASLTPDQVTTYTMLVQRRASAEPLPYLTGQIEFYGREFNVTPDVLIPRPETELLVETALDWMETHAVTRAIDAGTGSGCIAVTLAAETPWLSSIATDISTDALRVARSNAQRQGVGDRLSCVQADLLAPLSGPFDLIVSNPPYVARDEWNALPASVRQEPRLALLAGPQGLDIVRRLLTQARIRLRAGGLLLVEVGETQGDAVRALARDTFPSGEVCILKDLAGKERLLRVDA